MMAERARQRALEQAGLLHPAPEAVTASAFREQPEFFAAFDKVQVKYEMLRAHVVAGESVTAAAAVHGNSRARWASGCTGARSSARCGARAGGDERAFLADRRGGPGRLAAQRGVGGR